MLHSLKYHMNELEKLKLPWLGYDFCPNVLVQFHEFHHESLEDNEITQSENKSKQSS